MSELEYLARIVATVGMSLLVPASLLTFSGFAFDRKKATNAGLGFAALGFTGFIAGFVLHMWATIGR